MLSKDYFVEKAHQFDFLYNQDLLNLFKVYKTCRRPMYYNNKLERYIHINEFPTIEYQYDGYAVVLMDDGTWHLIDTSGG